MAAAERSPSLAAQR
ncbi:hypothetical protein Taro_004049 [Colocasia esculenta]|uniref:Uncharacterized protein n=1 Tax=Colocasia esculenta TaxID=4460 RepID=A0A843TQI8_COLES|nr:hypothetical protein [Colocasia esculenta]